MAFTDALASNPSSGVYGGIGPTNNDDILSIVNQIKDRNMRDYQNKAVFNMNLQNQQANLRKVFAPPGQLPATQGEAMTPMGNTVEKPDPNQMQNQNQIPAQAQAELGVRKQALDVQSQRLTNQGNLQQEALGIKQKQEALNQQKSDQINALKEQDLQRKINEAGKKFDQANAALKSRDINAAASLKARKDIAAAAEERHKAEIAMKDYQFKQTHDQMQKKIDELTKSNEAKQHQQTTVETNPDGTKKTTTTLRGDAAEKVKVTGKDGKSYMIPKDKVDEWNQQHQPDDQPQGDNNEDGES